MKLTVRHVPGTAILIAALLGALGCTTTPAGAEEYRELIQKGRDAFVSNCLNCHQTIDYVSGQFRTRSEWQRIVADMVARGARLDEPRQEAVVEYLSGWMLLVNKCRACHTFTRPLAAHKSLEEWRITVQRMAGMMPPALGMPPEQIEKLAVFLAVERPPR